MDPQQHDKTFVVTFLGVLGFLGAFTIGIIMIANFLSAPEAADDAALARLEERIKPVGQVITDEKMLLAATPVATARAPMGAAEIVTKICAACHVSGVLDSPKIGDKGEWNKRKAAGMSAMMVNAIKGKNQMPPRGGDAALSDDEVKAAVQEMLKQSGV